MKKGIDVTEEEMKNYDEILYLTDLEILCKWVSHVLAVVEKEA